MTWFNSLAELVQKTTGADTVELCVKSRPTLQVDAPGDVATTGYEATEWIQARLIEPHDPDAVEPVRLASWVGSAAVAPIVSPNAELGWVIAAHGDTDAFDQQTLETLTRAASLAESHLDSLVERAELDKLSELLRTSQRQLRETQTRLELSNQELEQFAYIAAHELLAPLRAVAVYAEILQNLAVDECEQPALLSDCVSEIRAGMRTMTEQVKYLLTLSRADHRVSELELVEARRVAYAAVDTLADLIDEAEATVEISELPTVRAHAIPLQSVFANLLTNAIRYRDVTRSLRIDVRGHDEGSEICIEVSDNGSGIDKDAQLRVFSLFERNSHTDDGLGVGLAVSRRILEGFGASIAVQSSDKGSTFVLRFPAVS